MKWYSQTAKSTLEQANLAFLAEDSIDWTILLGSIPKEVKLLSDPICEGPIYDPAKTNDRELHTRNMHRLMKWQIKCRKKMELGIKCDDMLWKITDQKNCSLIILKIEKDGRRHLN